MNVAQADPHARRRQSWTARLDENGLKGRHGYFTGTEWLQLEQAALAAGFSTAKKVKGVLTDIPDVTAYVMYVHRLHQGAGTN